MKKKISLLLCVLAFVLCFTGCGSSKNNEVEYDEATLEQATEFLIDYCNNADEATIDQWTGMTDFNLESQLTQAGLPFTPDSFLGALGAWQSGVKDCGEYESHGDFTYEASKDEVKVTTDAKFSDRGATLTFIYDDKMYLDSMTVDADYTRGEILKKAGLNTVLGMGTVFAVLIFISLIISLFRFIPSIQNAFSGKPKQTSQPAEPVTESVTAVAEDPSAETADTELAAVIAAAVAAAEGTTTDGFVVRSIRRRPSNRWNER